MNKIKSLGKQTLIYGLSSMVPRFLNYLLVPLYVWNFPAKEYGVVTEFYAYVAFLVVLLTYGMETAYFRFAKNADSSKVAFTTSFVSILSTSFIFLSLVLIFKSDISSLLDYSHHPEYIVWFAFILAFDCISAIPFAKLRFENRAILFSFFKIVVVIVNILLNLLFIIFIPKYFPEFDLFKFFNVSDTGVSFIFIANLISSFIGMILVLPYIVKSFDKFNPRLLKEMIFYAFPLMIAGLMGIVNDFLDRILLKFYLPDSYNVLHEMGIYGANAKLAIIIVLFNQMFRYAFEPFFFKYSDHADSKQMLADIAKYYAYFASFVFLLVMLFLPFLKYFIGNGEYWEGLSIIPILLFSNIFVGLHINLSAWYKIINKTQFALYITFIGAVITIVGNIIFIPHFSYVACAWVTFFSYFVIMLLSYFLSQKYYPIAYDVKKILISFLLAISIYALNFYLKIENVYLLSFLNFIMLLFYIFVIDKIENNKFSNYLKSKIW